MPRYIDAEAMIRKICGMKCGCERYECGYDEAGCPKVRDLETAPTVSPDEVLGVVHCKDCKWCHAGYCEKYDDLIPWGCANKPWEDWFCADGAKMEVSEDA